MARQKLHLGRNWYALHTILGFEEIVAENIKRRAEAFDMQDKIFNAIVPKEKVIEIKENKRQVVEKKIYPGYVFVDMIITDDSWYVVRNTPKVTGFIGIGTTPTPISKEEMEEIFKRMNAQISDIEINIKNGDLVKVLSEPFKGAEGKVVEVDEERARVKVNISLFGREVPVELDITQVKKI